MNETLPTLTNETLPTLTNETLPTPDTQWEEKNKRILATTIMVNASSSQNSNEDNRPVTMADISILLTEQLQKFLDTRLTAAIDNRLTSMIISKVSKAAQAEASVGIDDRATARTKELDLIIQHANDEKKLITDRSWSSPLVLAPPVVVPNDIQRLARPRFDPTVLPKYVHYKTNLQECC